MNCLWLRIRAPFAAFRGFQAGGYRATMPVMPPSAALGLILNLSGIEMRASTPGQTTLIRTDLPNMCLAIGTVAGTDSEICSLYQQLHSYPVGSSGKELATQTHGAKYWIVPVRRELLVRLDILIGIRSTGELFERIRQGLRGELDEPRYGLPFAGDNNFLFDRIDIVDEPIPTHWYVQMQPNDPPSKGSCRLTVSIDRADNSKTTSILYAPQEEPTIYPTDNAWTWTPKVPDTVGA